VRSASSPWCGVLGTLLGWLLVVVAVLVLGDGWCGLALQGACCGWSAVLWGVVDGVPAGQDDRYRLGFHLAYARPAAVRRRAGQDPASMPACQPSLSWCGLGCGGWSLR